MSRLRRCRSPPSRSAAAAAPPAAGEPMPSPAGAPSDRRDSLGREEIRGHVRALRSPRRLTAPGVPSPEPVFGNDPWATASIDGAYALRDGGSESISRPPRLRLDCGRGRLCVGSAIDDEARPRPGNRANGSPRDSQPNARLHWRDRQRSILRASPAATPQLRPAAACAVSTGLGRQGFGAYYRSRSGRLRASSFEPRKLM